MIGKLLKSFSISFVLILAVFFLEIIVSQEKKLNNYQNKNTKNILTNVELSYNESSIEEKDLGRSELDSFIGCYKSPIKEEDFSDELKIKFNEIQNLFRNNNKLVSFSYEDLYTGLHISYNENQLYFSASSIKAPVALYTYYLNSNGKLNMDEVLTYTENFYVEGSGTIQYEPFGTQYTIKDLLYKTIVNSDNIAYQMIANRVNYMGVKDYWKNLGADSFWTNNNIWGQINSKDGVIYMKELYKFTTAHPELKNEILNLFFNSVARLIKLPDDSIAIAHKSGWNSATIHDMAIVYDNEPYVLSINTLLGYSDYTTFFSKASTLINEFHKAYWKQKANYCYEKTFN